MLMLAKFQMFYDFHKCFVLSVNCTWSDWSDCSATCGPGVKSRTIAEEANFGGKPCDGLNQTACNLQDCPGESFFLFCSSCTLGMATRVVRPLVSKIFA